MRLCKSHFCVIKYISVIQMCPNADWLIAGAEVHSPPSPALPLRRELHRSVGDMRLCKSHFCVIKDISVIEMCFNVDWIITGAEVHSVATPRHRGTAVKDRSQR